MIKKVFLLLMLVINFMLLQNPSFADTQYTQEFYLNNLQKKIESNWIIPLNDRTKSTVLSFSVNNDGSVYNVSIIRSSGDVDFDKSVVDSVYKATPFEKFVGNKPINVQFFSSNLFTSVTTYTNPLQSHIVDVASRKSYIDFSGYTNNLQTKVNSNWKPKALSTKSAIASITIDKDGSLDDFKIVKSSRDKKFDTNVLDAIANSVPMDAFPAGIDAPNTDVQLVFNYQRNKNKSDKNKFLHSVNASVMNVKGYDSYIQQVKRVLADSLKNKRYYRHKDIIVEIKINKTGKMKYVKIQKSSKDKNFDRKILAILEKCSFPPVPETIPLDDVTLKYEILTQRGRSFSDFVFDYLLYGGTTGLKSFGLIE